MNPMLLPNSPYPVQLDLDLARLCARLVLDAYAMFDQWDKERPDERTFAWKRPTPPLPGLVYGAPLWATFRYAQFVPPRTARAQPTYKWVDRYCPIGFLATAPARVFVIFRGTVTDYEWTKVNFKFLQRDCDFDRFSEGRAHAGFLDYYRTVRQAVAQGLAGAGTAGKQVVFAGHSLGAALSTLAAHDVAEDDDGRATFHHYNFASPRVFNAKLARYFESLPIVTFRVVNVEDVVTTVPLPDAATLTYQHVGTPLCFSAQYGSVGANHAMENYQYALENPDAPQKA